ncbi:cation transporter [bacterium]|nr:cation transporter [bacterium]
MGGFWTNSIAIVSDAIHDLGDSLAIGLAYIFEKISKKKANEKYTY